MIYPLCYGLIGIVYANTGMVGSNDGYGSLGKTPVRRRPFAAVILYQFPALVAMPLPVR